MGSERQEIAGANTGCQGELRRHRNQAGRVKIGYLVGAMTQPRLNLKAARRRWSEFDRWYAQPKRKRMQFRLMNQEQATTQRLPA